MAATKVPPISCENIEPDKVVGPPAQDDADTQRDLTDRVVERLGITGRTVERSDEADRYRGQPQVVAGEPFEMAGFPDNVALRQPFASGFRLLKDSQEASQPLVSAAASQLAIRDSATAPVTPNEGEPRLLPPPSSPGGSGEAADDSARVVLTLRPAASAQTGAALQIREAPADAQAADHGPAPRRLAGSASTRPTKHAKPTSEPSTRQPARKTAAKRKSKAAAAPAKVGVQSVHLVYPSSLNRLADGQHKSEPVVVRIQAEVTPSGGKAEVAPASERGSFAGARLAPPGAAKRRGGCNTRRYGHRPRDVARCAGWLSARGRPT